MGARRELLVQTSLLAIRWNVKVLLNKALHVVVTNLTTKTVAVPEHSMLANLMERPTVIVIMLDDIDNSPLDAQFQSVNACPIYKEIVTN